MALGIPAVAVPHVGDQPYWGVRIAHLGVGPKAIPRLKLTAPKLAAELGAKIQAEDGVAKAADLIEQYA
jgi:sterol 3beta-glucosyltransferase